VDLGQQKMRAAIVEGASEERRSLSLKFLSGHRQIFVNEMFWKGVTMV
jgi:hypothetical protein